MGWLKCLLALALAATAIWLLTVLAAQQSLLTALVVAGLMAVVAVLLALRTGVLTGPLASRGLPAMVVIAALLAFAVPVALPAFAPAGAPRGAAPATLQAGWEPFDRAAIPALVAAGQTVFVDVTADWCITCQVNKKRVLDTGAVEAALQGARIVRMRADWTSPDPEIGEFLAAYGRYGIPFNIVYGPNAPAGIALPELLSDAAVLDALAAADQSRTLAAN
jgi:suppressor for copper-sensitivity B